MISFSDWVSAVADAGREVLTRRIAGGRQRRARTIAELCHELTTSRGEAMGTALAQDVVKAWSSLGPSDKTAFYQLLVDAYGPDPEQLRQRATAWLEEPGEQTYRDLIRAVEAPRQQLFRRINMAPNGTAALIAMRRELLDLLPAHPDFSAIDVDLKHLLISWFNRGFLTLARISWRTPALVLEKLIAYEAVHAMTGWDDLRRRLADDRRCFAFFHPALADEPLIFVEVALVKDTASNVQVLLAESERDAEAVDFDTAIFYSISNCQEGLRGISFGNFLIKQVVVELSRELPQLRHYATLSPIPGFRRWLDSTLAGNTQYQLDSDDRRILRLLEHEGWRRHRDACDALRPVLMRLCAHYLFHEKRRAEPVDPVARFHLGNGAAIERLNWLGDISANGLRQSYGLVVNYRYELQRVEENHEAFVNEGIIATAAEFRKLLKAERRDSPFALPAGR